MSCQASVVIPTYNRRELLRMTLESLTQQDVQGGRFEVIVVDDGSTDGSSEIVQGFASRLDVFYVRQDHCGFRVARARNLGIERARGETILFVDSGMILASRFVSSHLAAHRNDVPVAVIGYVHAYDFNLNSPALVDSSELVMTGTDGAIAALVKANKGRDIREPVYAAISDRVDALPAPWSLFWTTNVSVSRQVLSEAAGFDEEFVQWGMEDIELGYRLWRKGVRFVLARGAGGIHYPHARDNAGNLRSHAENRELFFRKHPAVETEAFLASDPLRFNFELQQFGAREQERRALGRGLGAGDSSPRNSELARVGDVVFGFRDGSLLKTCGSRAGIDWDEAIVEAARRQYPSIDTRTHLGIRTTFADRQFETCLIAGAALYVPRPWFVAMVAEATRVAKHVHALRFDGGSDCSYFQGARRMRLNDRVSICDLSSGENPAATAPARST